MTDKRDYIIEITARKDPLACFKMIEEQVGKGFSPAFGEKMLTHTNNPKIISMLAERTAAALAQGGDFAAYEALVFGIVAGREINDDTRGKLQEAAAAHGRKADFDYIDGLPKFIDRDGRRSNLLTHGIWENAPIWPDGILPVIRGSGLLRKCGKLISPRRRIFRRQRLISAAAGTCAPYRSAVPTRGGRTR